MTREQIQKKLDRVRELQRLVDLLLEKADKYTDFIESELTAIERSVSVLEDETFQHSPEPVKRLSVDDLERMMQKPTGKN
jgi:hypothetical protein